MAFERFDPDDPNRGERFRSFIGPHQVDEQIRRLVDRALRDLREDSDAFGLGGSGG